MSKKKVCFRKAYCPGKIPKCNRRFHCPANTNSNCEIIPKKPRVVRVKAWAYRGENEGETPGWHCVPEEYEGSVPLVPCTILISEKYLRRKP